MGPPVLESRQHVGLGLGREGKGYQPGGMVIQPVQGIDRLPQRSLQPLPEGCLPGAAVAYRQARGFIGDDHPRVPVDQRRRGGGGQESFHHIPGGQLPVLLHLGAVHPHVPAAQGAEGLPGPQAGTRCQQRCDQPGMGAARHGKADGFHAITSSPYLTR